ncbi:MAG: hypothetical protein CMM50_18565 [Rhodospirillaceae bacterium]|nr:hypothetical protein [Rhodospirillaceae bacterium]
MTDVHGKPDAEFRNHLAQGRLAMQRFRKSGRLVFYPRLLCPETGDGAYEWVDVSGRGTVYATSVIRPRPDAGAPYNVALIDLDEGPRMMSRVEGVAPEAVAIGMAVEAFIGREKDQPIVLFRPADSSGGATS